MISIKNKYKHYPNQTHIRKIPLNTKSSSTSVTKIIRGNMPLQTKTINYNSM